MRPLAVHVAQIIDEFVTVVQLVLHLDNLLRELLVVILHRRPLLHDTA